MARVVRRTTVAFLCPKCCRRFAHSVQAIRENPEVSCPYCNAPFDHAEARRLRERLKEEVIRHELRFRRGT